MKLHTLFFALFFCITLVGQPVKKIQQLLKVSNFVAFNNYISKEQKSRVDFGWETFRTIVGQYSEGVVGIEENVPLNDGTGASVNKKYSIYLLATKDSIFYYRFVKEVYKKKDANEWESVEEIVDTLRNDTKFSLFESVFKQTYGEAVNSNDLFLTSVVFGNYCGMTGKNPPYMERLNLLIKDENIGEIRQWLKSANAEKQLYALKGYRILVANGYNLTDDEKRIIAIVEQKSGTVATCSGCIFSKLPLQYIVAEINSWDMEHLKPAKTISSRANLNDKKLHPLTSSSHWWITVPCIILLLVILFSAGSKKTRHNT